MADSSIKKVAISNSVKKHFVDYAMSVVTDRALCEAADGLKPVQRRILYTMNLMNAGSNSAYRKSARIVGDVIGRFHPHGQE